MSAATATRQRQTAPAPSFQIPTRALDIDTTADRAVQLFKGGSGSEAIALIENARRGQSRDVQDALDRLVSVRKGLCYVLPFFYAPSEVVAGIRIDSAALMAPRMPVTAQMSLLTQQQQHDVYASIVEAKGSRAAVDALKQGERVILGLRSEHSTLVNAGRGTYSDRFAVLQRRGTTRLVERFDRANTQPTAQYDANQATNKKLHHAPHYDGQDVTGDGLRELGRMREGTYPMLVATHKNPPSAGTDFAFRPTSDAINNGRGMIERDSNHDGLFDGRDPNRLDDLDRTFKIHSGSRNSTDSSACQTIHPDDFQRFRRAVRNDRQTVWQYVLVKVRP